MEKAPKYTKGYFVGLPVKAILTYPMRTAVGFAAFLSDKVRTFPGREHEQAEEVGQLSCDIFRPMILRYFLSASTRPVN